MGISEDDALHTIETLCNTHPGASIALYPNLCLLSGICRQEKDGFPPKVIIDDGVDSSQNLVTDMTALWVNKGDSLVPFTSEHSLI